MPVEVAIDQESADGRTYLTWSPERGTIRLIPEAGPPSPVDVLLANDGASGGGVIELSDQRDGPRTPTLALQLPADGTPVEFYVAGSWPHASSADGDAALAVTAAATGEPLARRELMVRIRKDANTLGPAERDRFTTAFALLNEGVDPLFPHFREMHRERAALDQAHFDGGFLSWHRAYLLDLERALQQVDPAVTLPYWRFDQPAPDLFTPDFMGLTVLQGGVIRTIFAPTNLLRVWQIDGLSGVTRVPRYDQQTGSALVMPDGQTLGLGGDDAIFDDGQEDAGGFTSMEGNPHGFAHTSHAAGSWLFNPGTAPRDPLFFLLHCNVDRLWALWQWRFDRYDGTDPSTYFHRGTAGTPGAALIGHNLLDTMWPWDGDTVPPRPSNAPREPFPAVATAPAPGATPTVGDMIDYQGLLGARLHQGFGYDDVPFGVAPPS